MSETTGGRAADKPIDLDHLDRQTLGDAAIRTEVLVLFARQMEALPAELLNCPLEERARLAHRVRGVALGVGAHALAESAERLHADPASDAAAEALLDRASQAVRFVAILREEGAFWRS